MWINGLNVYLCIQRMSSVSQPTTTTEVSSYSGYICRHKYQPYQVMVKIFQPEHVSAQQAILSHSRTPVYAYNPESGAFSYGEIHNQQKVNAVGSSHWSELMVSLLTSSQTLISIIFLCLLLWEREWAVMESTGL